MKEDKTEYGEQTIALIPYYEKKNRVEKRKRNIAKKRKEETECSIPFYFFH